MAKREKKVVHTGVTTEQMETAFADYARCDARTQKINAQMDIEIIKIREKYANELGDLAEAKQKAFDILQVYATENKAELFTKKKSLETTHGVLGFRTGTPKLKTRKGFTWAAVTELLKEFLPDYVRITEEPAKDMLLSDRDLPETKELFPKVGVFVDQDESFFVEPKKEE
ncbi:MAG: host-nuclease inhibitor Gam family protein [Bacteroidetes bacterium]|nr:host-nuclease inhibitor Gam family protein [Bacteroidota bacterium]MCL2302934.1 host-nuclease inhibitor Gam family protein [Lentimicrobiaceae bacterium]